MPIQSPTREISDDLNRRVQIPAQVGRAVSLAPNLTEIAFAVGAGDRLVGITTFCNYPAETREIQKIGDTQNPKKSEPIKMEFSSLTPESMRLLSPIIERLA